MTNDRLEQRMALMRRLNELRRIRERVNSEDLDSLIADLENELRRKEGQM